MVEEVARAKQLDAADAALAAVEADALWGGQAARALALAYARAGQVEASLDTTRRILAPDLQFVAVGEVAAVQAATASDAPLPEAWQAALVRALRSTPRKRP